MCDLFRIMCETDFASYADDNTPYVLGDIIDNLIKPLHDDSIDDKLNKVVKWIKWVK